VGLGPGGGGVHRCLLHGPTRKEHQQPGAQAHADQEGDGHIGGQALNQILQKTPAPAEMPVARPTVPWSAKAMLRAQCTAPPMWPKANSIRKEAANSQPGLCRSTTPAAQTTDAIPTATSQARLAAALLHSFCT